MAALELDDEGEEEDEEGDVEDPLECLPLVSS